MGVEDLRAAYRLVHDTYVSKGYISEHDVGMRLRVFEAMIETATFVAKHEGRVIGVMSLVPDSHDLGLPSESVYTQELGDLRLQDRWVGEVTNLAVDPRYRQSDVFFKLSQCMVAHAINIGLDDLFVSISPGHATFFEMFLCFEPWGARRDYGQTTVDWVEGKRLDLHASEAMAIQRDLDFGKYAFLHDWFFAENPHLRVQEWHLQAPAHHRAEAIRKLIGFADLLQRFTQHQSAAIRKRLNGVILQNYATDAISAA
ncbi:MAG: GNAT family N-acetyltransferase [Planctomycetota bacterium]